VLGNTVFAAADRLAAPLHVDVSGSHRYNRAVLEYGLTHPVSFQPQQGLLLTDRFNPIDVREAENAMIRRRAWTADISER
jgi:hypothetical protein